MKARRPWQVQRTLVASDDGLRRWDLAYQLLLRWATEPTAGGAEAPLPPHVEEVSDADCALCPGLDEPPAAPPNH
jgi:hypothetical protein